RLLALADGGLDALDVAYDARGVAGGDLDQLNWMLAALGGAPLRRDLVEPGRRCIFGEKRAMHAGEHPHRSILTCRRRGAGETLREGAGEVEDGEKAGH